MPKKSIAGVRASYAEEFCQWLSEKRNEQYRLPEYSEALEHPGFNTTVSSWCTEKGHKRLEVSASEKIQTWQIYFDRALDRVLDRIFDRFHDLFLNFTNPQLVQVSSLDLFRPRRFERKVEHVIMQSIRSRGIDIDDFSIRFAIVYTIAHVRAIDFEQGIFRSNSSDSDRNSDSDLLQEIVRNIERDIERAIVDLIADLHDSDSDSNSDSDTNSNSNIDGVHIDGVHVLQEIASILAHELDLASDSDSDLNIVSDIVSDIVNTLASNRVQDIVSALDSTNDRKLNRERASTLAHEFDRDQIIMNLSHLRPMTLQLVTFLDLLLQAYKKRKKEIPCSQF